MESPRRSRPPSPASRKPNTRSAIHRTRVKTQRFQETRNKVRESKPDWYMLHPPARLALLCLALPARPPSFPPESYITTQTTKPLPSPRPPHSALPSATLISPLHPSIHHRRCPSVSFPSTSPFLPYAGPRLADFENFAHAIPSSIWRRECCPD